MNMKRMRGRGGGGGGFRQGGGGGGFQRHQGGGGSSGNGQPPMNRNHVFDSSGPDVRLRGTAQQLFEKYLQLGRDATGGGDRVTAEAYFQHAEHYFRIMGAMNAAQAAQQAQQQQRRHERDEAAEPGEPTGEAETIPAPRPVENENLAADLEAELAAEIREEKRGETAA
ncbi:DUF4167 domain-containing protein [Rhodovarius crocodyli]|nr:DUF4167 domain-containing protein [Rhodovarius crocodyli]